MRGSKVAILNYMKEHNGITSKEAFEHFGVTRLAACIFDLRQKGYLIDTLMLETVTRFDEPTKYAKYIFKGVADGNESTSN